MLYWTELSDTGTKKVEVTVQHLQWNKNWREALCDVTPLSTAVAYRWQCLHSALTPLLCHFHNNKAQSLHLASVDFI